MPIWRSRSPRSEKSWTSAWSAHEVVATSYWHLGSLLGRETIGSDREASTTKFYCKTLSCWSWLWLRSIHGSISVVGGIGHVVGLSYPAWGHSWKTCGHSWTAYGWSWRSDQYNHSKLSHWCGGGWGCEVSCGGHHRPRGKTTTGSALVGAVFDIAQILAYLVHNMSRSQLYLGFGHFGWLPSFFSQ